MVAQVWGPGQSVRQALKLLECVADKSCVWISAFILGVSLSVCAQTLVGTSEWGAGRFVHRVPNGRSSASLAASSMVRSPVSAALPGPLPVLPDTSDHLPGGGPGYSFRRDVPEVRLRFTVADEQGHGVGKLSADEVEILDNRAPVPHFSAFEYDDNVPLHLGLIVDTSDSVRRVLPEEKAAATNFLQRVLRPGTDTVFLMGLGGTIKMWQSSTGDPGALSRALSQLNQPGWGTRLFDGLYVACAAAQQSDDNRQGPRNALVVLSDGDDTDSLRTLADVIAAAQRAEVQIYPITLHSQKLEPTGDEVLQRLADATGGRLYVAVSSKELGTAFDQIQQDLRAQYYVSFRPQQSGAGFHSLEVEVRAARKLIVHARQGYYAPPQ